MLQVLDDNIYELRSRQREAEFSTLEAAGEAPAVGSRMQIEPSATPNELLLPSGLPPAQPQTHVLDSSGAAAAAGSSAGIDLAGSAAADKDLMESNGAQQDEEEERRSKKKVKFAEPWIPHHKREANGALNGEPR